MRSTAMRIVSLPALTGALLATFAVAALGAERETEATEATEARAFVEGMPTPKQMLRVDAGTTYTVPQGKLFVATGLVQNGRGEAGPAHVRFGDVAVALVDLAAAEGVVALPTGLVAGEGTVISLASAVSNEQASGQSLLGYVEQSNATRKLTVAGIVAPRQMRIVVEGDSLVVPPRHFLVLTGAAALDWGADHAVSIDVDGETVARLHPALAGGTVEIPAGLVARPGSHVKVRTLTEGGHTPSVLYGYLQDF